MKRIFLLAVLTCILKPGLTQDLPYSSIPDAPEAFEASAVLARFMDGLGYRYYWATEGLTEKDLLYLPSEGSRSTMATLVHIRDLCMAIDKTIKGQVNDVTRPNPELTFEELRKATLECILNISERLRSGDIDFNETDLVFASENEEYRLSFWYVVNGPMSDAMYHTGQIVAFRRASGNPVDPRMNVLTGRTEE